MKVAVILESPLLEAFSLIGADYLYSTDEYMSVTLGNDVTMVIVAQELEKQFNKRYPDKIIVGV